MRNLLENKSNAKKAWDKGLTSIECRWHNVSRSEPSCTKSGEQTPGALTALPFQLGWHGRSAGPEIKPTVRRVDM